MVEAHEEGPKTQVHYQIRGALRNFWVLQKNHLHREFTGDSVPTSTGGI